ncbi:hypothetical protein SAMN05192550_2954 [Flavobacterium glycines]|uniref:Uncharacterized protein n=1 Tax=Flavobacterium glycines TaxID=551990 RepID=A0A511CHG1_9FLAO|nr:hypothetical protein [Flavobacterium glycines]GEL12082.1 hypothetical protein FGL01_28210 [Flavobacterium glycines]SDJ89563.1 hypothetical protein SAMN05192550_2954 [Flavobacterium glycines]
MEDIIISLLPVITIIAVWIYIYIKMKKSNKNNKYVQNQEEMILLLKEIRDELKDLNKKNLNN